MHESPAGQSAASRHAGYSGARRQPTSAAVSISVVVEIVKIDRIRVV
jgi:hypothetical protein